MQETLRTIRAIADEIETYTERHLFDNYGLLMSGVDVRTNKPFDRGELTEDHVPRRAMFDPWSMWTYEDSVMSAGHYIEGLILKFECTGDADALARARRTWHVYRDVGYQSTVYGGMGCFLRPYGGFDQMEKFGEPLGTDQAAPLFCGVYRLLPHMDECDREEATRLMIQMLQWYADQGYAYRYYKTHQHYWRPPGHQHGSSFYLPALSFAAKVTGQSRWKSDLAKYLHRQLNDPEILDSSPGVAWNFKQSGLVILRDILGPAEYDRHFTPEVHARILRDVDRWLEKYSEPGMIHRLHEESRQPGFKPYLQPGWQRHEQLGMPNWVHGGRYRPRHEVTILASLGALGNADAARRAAELLCLRRRVPHDFTIMLNDDEHSLPDVLRPYFGGAGAAMLDWWRNAWVLLHGTDAA